MSRRFEMQANPTLVQPVPLEQWQNRNLEVKENIYVLAEADAFRDMLRAALTKQALDNTAFLAALGAHYAQIAPGGSSEYHYIVETYAKAAMAKIFEGSW